jgi:NAD(P)-dependent dehydrogenase (short-subunit alcohol dehydrogenase family)
MRIVNAYTAATKTALITGSTDGIGLTTAKQLASKGYNTIIHGRNPKRIQEAVNTVTSHVNANSQEDPKIYSVESDISTVQGCKALAHKVQSILKDNDLSLDVLMNNAGVFEPDHVLTDDHLEMTFAVNVMAPFVITSNLLPELLSLKNSLQSRVVITSSISQCHSIDNWDDLQFLERPYSTHRAYSESKLFDAMLSAEIATRFTNADIGTDRITCNSLDPGTVNTKMLLAGWGPCGIDVEDALDESWICTNDDVKDVSGAYFNWKSVSKKADAYKTTEREQMWNVLSNIDPVSAAIWEDLTQFS